MSNAEAMSVIEWATVKAVTTAASGRRRRNGMTRQNRNSRWSMPSRMWKKPSLVNRSAAWCQRGSSCDDAGIAVHVEGALGVAGRQQPHHHVDPQPEPGQPGPDGEARLVRLDVVGEGHVEQAVLPVEGGVVGQGRAGQAGLRLVVAGERLVGGQRDAGGGDPRAWPAAGRPRTTRRSRRSRASRRLRGSAGPGPGRGSRSRAAGCRRRASP